MAPFVAEAQGTMASIQDVADLFDVRFPPVVLLLANVVYAMTGVIQTSGVPLMYDHLRPLRNSTEGAG